MLNIVQNYKGPVQMKRGKLMHDFAALGVAIPLLVSAVPSQASDTTQLAAKSESAAAGKPVLLRVGKGFDTMDARAVARALNKVGCPIELTKENARRNKITVEVDGQVHRFRVASVAASIAEKLCLNRT